MLAGQTGRTELLRFLTAGSVDDGKSTLIGRLLYDTQAIHDDHLAAVRRDSARRGGADGALDLSLLMDGLKAEREQGITIDVAYRYFATNRRKFIIADCPGHEQYTRNMATGASNCDLAIILIDARKGLLSQTRRHSFIISLLGIKHAVVAVNKMDLVGYDEDVFERIVGDYTEFATRLVLPDLRFIPISALSGDNLAEASERMPWYRGETLLHYLETVHIASDRNLVDLRLPIQYVNRPTMDFRGFCGTIASGVVRTGDEVVVLPSGVRTRVRSILGSDGATDEAFAPMAVTVTLADEVDVSRGDMLAHPGNLPRLEQNLEAMIVWMASDPLVPGRSYFLKQTTSTVAAQVALIRYRVDVKTLHRQPATVLGMNDIGRCTVQLARRLPVDPYERNRATGAFILIDRLTNATVGAGMILDRSTASASSGAHADGEAVRGDANAPAGPVTTAERAARYGQRPVTVLLSGPASAEPLALARALERRLFDQGRLVLVIDDVAQDLHRMAQLARAISEAGAIVLAVVPTGGEVLPRDVRGAFEPGGLVDVRLVDAGSEPPDATSADLILDRRASTLAESVGIVERLLQSRGVWR